MTWKDLRDNKSGISLSVLPKAYVDVYGRPSRVKSDHLSMTAALKRSSNDD